MRARNVKPGFFKNADLAELPFEARLLFIGLWCLADREGRLQDRPRQIRAEIFPYEMEVDVESLLSKLTPKMVIRYVVKQQPYIQIQNFVKHQNPHYKEPPSEMPSPKSHKDSKYIGGGVPEKIRQAVFQRDNHHCKNCNSSENLTVDHIKPRVLGGSNDIDNLQCLCKRCNTSKNNRIMGQRSVDVDPTSNHSCTLIPDSPSLIPDSPLLNTATQGVAGVFESLWQEYPKRLGKKQALRHFMASVKTEADVIRIRNALAKYRAHVAGKEREFIQHASTWFNNWQDWENFEEDKNASHGGKSVFSPSAFVRAKRDAEKLREESTAGAVSGGVRDLQNVSVAAPGGGGTRD